ncbi:MAG: sugar phosphate isomerase/epimerase [Clostridia bacterium]|nr:sugar phosphate isomerase/epimerase [Clostridia bacterium]
MNFSMYAKFANRLKKNGIEETASYAKALGFTSVELFEFIGRDWEPCVHDEQEAKHITEVLAANGLSVACYSIAVNLLQEGMTPDTVTPMERELMHYADMAAAVGSPFLHHTLLLGVDSGVITMETALQSIVPVAVRVAKYAHALGVSCIYEDQGQYFNGVEGFGAFYRAVKAQCPYVGVCGDIGNTLFVDEDPARFFRAFASEMRHIHIKDYIKCAPDDAGAAVSQGRNWIKETIPGRGCIDFPSCLAALREVGYSGAFALENNHEEDFAYGAAETMKLLQAQF